MDGRWTRLCLCAIIASLIFASGGALAAGNYAFSPPTGWYRVHTGTNSKWLDPTRTQAVSLFQTYYAGDLNSFVTRMLKQERTQHPNQVVWTNKNYMICGQHTGRYVIWTANAHGKSMVWEQMMALWGYDGYIVSYTRPGNNGPSSTARGSLLSICGVGTIPEQPGGVPVMPSAKAPPPPDQTLPATTPQTQPEPNPTGTIPHPYMPVIPN